QYAIQFIQALAGYPFLQMPSFSRKQPSWYAFVMQFNAEKANGVSIEQFMKAALAEGLEELDRPGSTGPIHNLPLFTHPELAMPRLYDQPIPQPESLEMAERFYANALKLPMWAFADEQVIVNEYINGLVKV